MIACLLRLRASLIELLREGRRLASQIDGRPVRSLREHEGILEAIEAHDVPLARQRTTAHLETVQQLIQEVTRSTTDH